MQNLSNDCGKFEKYVFYRTDNRLYWIGAILSNFFQSIHTISILFVQMSASLDCVEVECCYNTFSMAANVNAAT